MKIGAAVAGIAACFLSAAPAAAHAERSASSPREGAAIAAAPGELNITFTEPPTADAAVEVLDGCDRDVVADVEVQNFEITAALAEGQPGRWIVRTSVISGIDGHNTRDQWSFQVRGSPDCSAEPDPPAASGDRGDEDSGGVPAGLLVTVAATVVLVALGLVIRSRSS